jgi:hypothetical protein
MSENEQVKQPAEAQQAAKDEIGGEAAASEAASSAKEKAPPKKKEENRVVRLLEKNPLGMTLPEMAGGPRQIKKIKLLRPMLAEAIRSGQVMPISQRAGNTVYRLVKFMRSSR